MNIRTLIVFLALSFFLAPMAQADTTLVSQPEIKVGDMWMYNRIDGWTSRQIGTAHYEVVAPHDEGFLVRRSDKIGAKETSFMMQMTRDMNTRSSGLLVYSPSNATFVFPLEKGKEWTKQYTAEEKGLNNKYSYTARVKVEEAEKIKVPAGSFDTIRIKVSIRYEASTSKGSGTGTMQETFWYSPAVKRFVKYAYEDTSWAGTPLNKYQFELSEFIVK